MKGLILACLSYFLPIVPLMIAVGLAIALDTALGVYRALKEGTFSSRGIKGGLLPKMFIYQIVILTVFGIDTLILGEFANYFSETELIITKITALVLIGIEALSIKETFEDIFKIKVVEVIKNYIDSYKSFKKFKDENKKG